MSDTSEVAETPDIGFPLSLGNPLIAPLIPVGQRMLVAQVDALDQRLREQARGRGEVMLRQIRLKWWEEQLASLQVDGPQSDPLLIAVAHELLPHVTQAQLSALGAAWQESVDSEEAAEIAARGARLFALLTAVLGGDAAVATEAGQGWALAEEAMHADAAQAARLWDAAAAQLGTVPVSRLPRPLAALTGLTRRVARKQGVRALAGEQLLILRIGLFGR